MVLPGMAVLLSLAIMPYSRAAAWQIDKLSKRRQRELSSSPAIHFCRFKFRHREFPARGHYLTARAGGIARLPQPKTKPQEGEEKNESCHQTPARERRDCCSRRNAVARMEHR